MRPFNVPKIDEVTDENRQILEQMENKLGFIPNIYAAYAYSSNALGRYLAFSNGKTSLSNKEKEVVKLVTSEVNGCTYCLAAHSQSGKMNGFSDEQILELRVGKASFDHKLDALARVTRELVENRGKVSDEVLKIFFDAGYTKENLIDVIVGAGEKSVTNLLHNMTDVPIDFPEAPELSDEFSGVESTTANGSQKSQNH
ncbi:MAG: carboxymuconolactone decarboxylase family protein [Balneolales bacterium]